MTSSAATETSEPSKLSPAQAAATSSAVTVFAVTAICGVTAAWPSAEAASLGLERVAGEERERVVALRVLPCGPGAKGDGYSRENGDDRAPGAGALLSPIAGEVDVRLGHYSSSLPALDRKDDDERRAATPCR